MPMENPRNSLQKTARVAVAAVCLLAMLFTAATASSETSFSLPELTDEQTQELRSGEIIVELDRDGEVVTGWGLALVQDPIDDVVPILARCWEYSRWQDNIVDTAMVRRISDNSMVCKGKTLTPFPARDRYGHFQVEYAVQPVDGQRSFVYEYEYLEGTGNLEEVFGHWILTPYGSNQEHTLVKHVFSVNLGSLIPTFLIQWVLNRNVPQLAYNIRQHLGEHRTEEPYWDDYEYD